MPDASPPKWHLAHTTWFFATFVLEDGFPDDSWRFLFNSYYEGAGPRWPRAHRGALSRPTVAEVKAWRRQVDELVLDRLPHLDPTLLELGLQHEQQHQELLVSDVKHGLLQHPFPVAITKMPAAPADAPAPGFEPIPGGLVEIGHAGPGFSFDNEGPIARVHLEDFALGRSLVTNAQFLEFVEDGGYRRPDLWLSDGWDAVCHHRWESPLYWERRDGAYLERTLGGDRPLALHAPVTHVSFFEAEAFARWAGCRLPTEAEWERAARRADPRPDGTFLDDGALHPEGRPAPAHGGLTHLLGEVWEHTSSPYRPYPGFQPAVGTVGEYNGKFMNGQYILRGGSCVTPRDHIRISYRNFFGPDKRWIFAGLRLGRDR